MRILSLYYGHDSNICLLEDGYAVAHIEKERLSRVKHDQGWMDAIEILNRYDWHIDSIDCVVINPDTRRTLDGNTFRWDLSGTTYQQSPDYLRQGRLCTPEHCFSEHTIRLFGRSYKCYAVDHHLAHIAGAIFTSPFEEAGVLSADGGGDTHCCALAFGRGARIEKIEYGWGEEELGKLLNIGSTWASIGELNFGYQRLEAAGKLMGLSSYGKSDQRIQRVLNTLALYHHYAPFPCHLFRRPKRLDPCNSFAQSLAASLEELTKHWYLHGVARLKTLWNPKAVVMTGGCSMNCVAVSAVHDDGAIEQTWVPAQPHDGGLSLGQALFVWHNVLGHPRTPREWSPFLGSNIDGSDTLEPIATAIDYLTKGKTVGLCYGAAESGPRALGHRSILADPRRPEMTEVINRDIKKREWFRPLAPMVLEEEFDQYFTPRVPSRYMSYVVRVVSDALPAVTHIDRTTRPQVVRRDDDIIVRSLLEQWASATGCGVLLNTSFNSQEPLVDTIDDARATWQRTAIDILVTPEGVETKK